jgi:CO/xanthine dehydrogenase FAD-binding subunit
MKPAPFDYLAPTSVSEALDLLAERGEDAKILAGGQSLVPLLNFRLAKPATLIDINRLDTLSGVRRTDGVLSIGALTRQRDGAQSDTIQKHVPLLVEAIEYIGHPAIQNRGTIGGSLAHADPAAELPVAALALEAEFQLQRTAGSRAVPAEAFNLGYLTTAMQPDELMVEATFRIPPAGTGWCFTEVARRHGDFALVAVAVLLGVQAGQVSFARVALGGVGPAPLRATAAENALLGQPPSAELFAQVGALAAEGLETEEDLHASADYRRHLASVLVKRALATAQTRVGRQDA